jgi:hypothetical protein
MRECLEREGGRLLQVGSVATGIDMSTTPVGVIVSVVVGELTDLEASLAVEAVDEATLRL